MTDTRKECEQWQIESGENYADGTFDESYFLPFDAGYKACQSLNDKRIQQLLAVIELQREALRKICRDADSRAYAEQIADEALAIKPQDVELVEVAEMRNGEWVSGYFARDLTAKLYKIQMKGK